MTEDARIPVWVWTVLPQAPPAGVVVLGGAGGVMADVPAGAGLAALPHAAGCACCFGRSGVGLALSDLYRRAARDKGPGLRAVWCAGLAAPALAALRAALAEDVFCRARFRWGGVDGVPDRVADGADQPGSSARCI